MNFWKTFVCGATILASATVAFPQDINHASFNLPYAARWNSTLLQPGEYELSIPSASSWPQVINLKKDGRTISLLAAAETSVPESDVSELKLTKVGATAVVTDLSLGGASKSFHFALSKASRQELASVNGERASTKTVALVSAAK